MNKNKRKPTEEREFVLDRRDPEISLKAIDQNVTQSVNLNLNKNMKI